MNTQTIKDSNSEPNVIHNNYDTDNYDTDNYDTDDYDSDGIQVPSKGGCLGWCGAYLDCSYCKESNAYWAFCSTEKCPNYKGEPHVRIKNSKKNKKGEIICNYCAKNQKSKIS